MLFQYGNQEVAETAIRAECSGVDGPHGTQEKRYIHDAIELYLDELCPEHVLGELFQERNVVFVGEGIHACVKV